MLAEKMEALGLPVLQQDILSAPHAARIYLEKQNPASCFFVVADTIMEDFGGFEVSDKNPDMVVLGDIGAAWDYTLLNNIFEIVVNGAELVALHKNKFWESSDGLRVDIGLFVAGLEYVTGKAATIIGKPSATFFQSAARELNCPVESILMIGDDIDSDVGGAQDQGLIGLLVRTGKYREEYAQSSAVRPDAVLDSIADLPDYLENKS